jgi:hypothetical protein
MTAELTLESLPVHLLAAVAAHARSQDVFGAPPSGTRPALPG